MGVSHDREPGATVAIEKCERGFAVWTGSYQNRQLFAFSTLRELLAFLERLLREEVDD
jgi:hypothetical protein